MTYGETIRQARERAGMTQEMLAERLDVSRQAVSKWEKDLSRPTASKLAALTALLNLPADTWSAIDRAAQKTAEAVQRSDCEVELLCRIKRWKWGAALLAGLLCLSLCLNVYGAARLSALRKAAHGMPPEQVELGQDLAETFPEMLELMQLRRSYDFGDQPTGDYDPALVPELKELAAHGKSDNALWSGMFEDENGVATAFLQVVRTNPLLINTITYWDVYLVYAMPDGAGDLDWKILYRMADENCYVNNGGGLTVEPFDNVLGYSGFKLSLTVGGAGTYVEYITQRSDGTPCLMLSTGTTGGTSVEFDVNEDGVKEIIVPDGQPTGWEIYTQYKEWTEVYTLESQTSEEANVSFDPNEGGFIVCDETGNVVARYIYQDGNWGGEMVRRPVTDVTIADYPDVAGTALLFDLEYFNDSIDPDTLRETESGVRITPRQQAYLALQQLYDLTGQRFDQLYCAVDGRFGMTCFSLLEGGLSERCFYSADMPERYGGEAGSIPSVYFAWWELGIEWSPLRFQSVTEQPDYQDAWQTKILSWYYDQLWLMQTGAEAFVRGDGLTEQELWLTNGDLFTATFQETDHGLALTCLTGPYPDGQVYH